MSQPKKYYKIWLHVEEVTTDQEGEETYEDLDTEFMPLSLAEFQTKEEVKGFWDEMESETKQIPVKGYYHLSGRFTVHHNTIDLGPFLSDLHNT